MMCKRNFLTLCIGVFIHILFILSLNFNKIQLQTFLRLNLFFFLYSPLDKNIVKITLIHSILNGKS